TGCRADGGTPSPQGDGFRRRSAAETDRLSTRQRHSGTSGLAVRPAGNTHPLKRVPYSAHNNRPHVRDDMPFVQVGDSDALTDGERAQVVRQVVSVAAGLEDQDRILQRPGGDPESARPTLRWRYDPVSCQE